MRNQELHQTVLECFIKRLRQEQGENLLKVVLFGSVARGEQNPSDIDVFVLLKDAGDGSRNYTEEIVDLSYDIDLDEGNCETYISPFVRVLTDYQKGLQQGVAVYQSIQEEGRVLYDSESGR